MKTISIIQDVPYRYGQAIAIKKGDEEIKFTSAHGTVNVPYLVGIYDQELSDLIHLFITTRAEQGRKDLKPYSRSFLHWLRWMDNQGVHYLNAVPFRNKHPTYGYRNHLVKLVTAEKIASSTAAGYISVIRQFYEFLKQYKQINIKDFYNEMVSIVDGYRTINTSDLSIRKRNTERRSLNPLNIEEKKLLLSFLLDEQEDMKIMIRFMLFCGLRLNEVLTMNRRLFDESLLVRQSSSLVRGIWIGPKQGVMTKNSETRELFISAIFLKEVLDFINSDRQRNLSKKWGLNNTQSLDYEPLFITRNGNQFSDRAFYSRWYPFIKKIHQTNLFRHKPHDLRATFATDFLLTAMDLFPRNLSSVLSSLKYWMGHKSESQSLKYVQFLERNKVSSDVAQVMDKFVIEAIEVPNKERELK